MTRGRESGALGAYIRAQRQMADLSLRQLGEMTQISNAYLSQLERGLHQPSLRILRSIAEALSIPWEELLTRAGVTEAGQMVGGGRAPVGESDTERAIMADPHLAPDEREMLVQLYRTFRAKRDGAAQG